MTQLFDFILHIDEHLITIVNSFGPWTYVILFAMVFIETGVVVFPFLPGDSLLFAASALAANALIMKSVSVSVLLLLPVKAGSGA